MPVEYYSIHGIINVAINKQGYGGLFSNLNREFDYFRVKKADPHIILNLGRFSPETPSSHNYKKKYYIRENYLYVEDDYKGAKWQLEVTGLEDDRITVNYHPIPAGVRKLFPYFSMQNIFLRELIEILLIKKGYNPIHGASIGYNGHGYILAGKQHSYKTSIAMDLIRYSRYVFFGDDRVLLYKGQIYSYPLNISSFTFWLKHREHEESKVPLYKLRLLLWTLAVLKKREKISINIGQTARLDKLFMLSMSKNTRKRKVDIYPLAKDKAYNILTDDIKKEWTEGYMPILTGLNRGFFGQYLEAYLQVNKKSNLMYIWDKYKESLAINLGDAEVYLVELPDPYNSDIAKKIADIAKPGRMIIS